MVRTTVMMDRMKLAVLTMAVVIRLPLAQRHHHTLAEPITSSVTTVGILIMFHYVKLTQNVLDPVN